MNNYAFLLTIMSFISMGLFFYGWNSTAFAVHILVVITTYFVLHKRKEYSPSTLYNLMAMSLLIPIFGSILLTLGCYFANKKRTHSFLEAYKDFLRFRLDQDSTELLRRELELRGELRSREPWQTLVQIGESVQEKHQLLAQVTQQAPDKSAPILNILRVDPVNEIAVAASQKYFELESLFLDKIKRARDLCQNAPEISEVWSQLSSALMSYISAGFCDEEATQDLYEEAESALDNALKLSPKQKQLWLAKGKIQLIRHKLLDAISTLETGLKLSPQDPQISNWLAEAYFKSGQYSKTKHILAHVTDDTISPWHKFWNPKETYVNH